MRSLLSATGGSSQKRAIEAAIQKATKGRRKFLLGRLQELQEVAQLQVSLEHHTAELEKEREDTAGRARIRMTGTAFPRVTVQIGEVYKMLNEDVEAVIFYLNQEDSQVAQELL